MTLTYSSYLKIDELLELQQPLSDGPEGPEHDETLFIIIHQVYELWFKQTLHEIDRLLRLFQDDGEATPDILFTLRRVRTILKTMVAQIDILETMTPIQFLSFRDRLESGSGFQSPQFREFEFALGLRDRRYLIHHRDNPRALERLEKRLAEPSLYQTFLDYLRRRGYELPAAVSQTADEPPEGEEIRAALISVYRSDHNLTQVCESLVDLDEGLQEWRYRHVKMVERTIGTKHGTGGSAGAEYLKTTLFRSVFPDLWTIRTDL